MTMTSSFELPEARSAIRSALWRNRLFLTIILAHMLGGATVSYFIGLPYWSELLPALGKVLILMVKYMVVLGALYVIWRILRAAFWVRPSQPIQWLISDLRATASTNIQVSDGITCFVPIAILATTFTCLKNAISHLNPFNWDPLLSELDRALHGGADPWTLLWPIFGSPFTTTFLNAAYHVWFVLIYLLAFIAAFDRRDPTRGKEYLVAFALTWIVGGNILATFFSSVGPVYFNEFGFGDTYLAQMENLQKLNETSPVWALSVQANLLEAFKTEGIIRGISAMPSMHVASSVTMALFAFGYSRWLGWAFTIFAGLILIGSVHLAWHYAVDGYFAVAIALACWWVAKILVKRFAEPSY